MTGYYLTAFGTFPSFRFLLQETLNAIIFNIFEVLYHAHMVESAVTLIEGFQEPAREIGTFETEPYQACT
jgi:hypothetical protein